MHQATAHGARRARYRGLAKTRLDHVYMACALNVLRLEVSSVSIERHSWDEAVQAFHPSWTGAFQRTPEGWF